MYSPLSRATSTAVIALAAFTGLRAAAQETSGSPSRPALSSKDQPWESVYRKNVPSHELADVASALKSYCDNWCSLDPIDTMNLRTWFHKMPVVAGLKFRSVDIEYLRAGQIGITLQLDCDPTLRTSERLTSLLNDDLTPKILTYLGDLQKRGVILHLSGQPTLRGINENAQLEFTVVCHPGLSYYPPPVNLSDTKLATPQGRSNIFKLGLHAISDRKFTNAEKIPPEITNPAYCLLLNLGEWYNQNGMPKLAALAIAMQNRIVDGARSRRNYVDCGRLQPDDLVGFPHQITTMVTELNEATRNMPARSVLLAKQERVSAAGDKIGFAIDAILKVERAAEFSHDSMVDIAQVEILDAIRFVKEQIGAQQSPQLTSVATAIRKYFNDYLTNNYDFSPEVMGMSYGMVTRRTDCSMRTLIAHELFSQFGFDVGVEVIALPSDQGGIRQDLPTHTFNFVETSTGRKYFDYSRGRTLEYMFSDHNTILKTYYAKDPSKLVVDFSGTDPGQIAGYFLMEQVLDEKNALRNQFGKDPLPLAEFLLKYGELVSAYRRIREVDRVTDSLFDPDHMPKSSLWKAGTVESIKKVLGIH